MPRIIALQSNYNNNNNDNNNRNNNQQVLNTTLSMQSFAPQQEYIGKTLSRSIAKNKGNKK